MAALKAGASYVPLDGNIVSSQSLDHVLDDSAADVVLVLRKFESRLTRTPTICLDDFECQCSTKCSKPADSSSAEDSAYVIYTSGKWISLLLLFSPY